MDRATERYLRRLRRALSPLPARKRDEVLADVGAHISDSVAGGAKTSDVLVELGDPMELAAATFSQLDESSLQGGRARRASRVLSISATCLAIATAVAVIHLIEGSSAGSVPIAVLLIPLVPAAVLAGALMLPQRLAMLANLAVAGVLFGANVLGFGLAGPYVPVALLATASALVPLALSRGFNLSVSPAWRWGGAALILVGLLYIASRFLSTLSPVGLWILAALALAGICTILAGAGLAVGRYGLLTVGAILVALVFVPSDVFLLPAWLIGAFLLAVGITSTVTTHPSDERSI